MLKPVISVEPV